MICYEILSVDIQRRSLEYEERKYLVEMGYVTETQSNLGLLAVKSDDVLLVMQEEYPAKYKVSCVYFMCVYIDTCAIVCVHIHTNHCLFETYLHVYCY